MTPSEQLLRHAVELLVADGIHDTAEVRRRRAVSAAYYSLFHRLTGDAAALLAPNVPQPLQARIARWFDHAEMKQVCGRFTKAQLEKPLKELIGNTASVDLQMIATSFIQLQAARHAADYDLSLEFSHQEALQHVQRAIQATAAWRAMHTTVEANVFLLSLLLWKQWEKDR